MIGFYVILDNGETAVDVRRFVSWRGAPSMCIAI